MISLIGSRRRGIIQNRLRKLSLNYEFLDATDKELLADDKQLLQYNGPKCKERYGRDLTEAEKACFISHYRCWMKISKVGSEAVILEDDALLTSEFNKSLEFLSAISEHFDAVLLGQSKLREMDTKYHYFQNPIFNSLVYKNLKVGNVFKLWTSGAVGYYLSSHAAKTLVEGTKDISCVADDWKVHSAQGLKIGEVRPYVVWEDFDNLESSIEPDRSEVVRDYSPLADLALELPRFVRAIFRNIRALLKKNERFFQ